MTQILNEIKPAGKENQKSGVVVSQQGGNGKIESSIAVSIKNDMLI